MPSYSEADFLRDIRRSTGGIAAAQQLNIPTSKCYKYLIANFISETLRASLFKLVDAISYVEDPVIIYGETGTGKELIAKALAEDRKPFVPINVTSLPDYLLESELFGHRIGAFTGATTEKIGLLEMAEHGTIFLDEIGDMPLPLQAKILRAIQERQIRRVGCNLLRDIRCRFVCATHHDLSTSVVHWKTTGGREGFREDLFWRLCVYEIRIPPLRDRRSDIRELVDAKFDPQHLLSEEFLARLEECELFGNVRELEARCKRELLRMKLST